MTHKDIEIVNDWIISNAIFYETLKCYYYDNPVTRACNHNITMRWIREYSRKFNCIIYEWKYHQLAGPKWVLQIKNIRITPND